MADERPVERYEDDGTPVFKEPEKVTQDEGEKITPEEKIEEATEEVVEVEPEVEPVVPVRRSVQQHIIARQKETIEKLRSKKEEPVEDEFEDFEEEKPRSTDVAREVRRAVAPILQSIAEQADEKELHELFSSEPEAKAMSKQIKAYMQHPSYKGVPPAVIYHHLAFDKATTGVLKKKAVADSEAKLQKGAGSTRRPVERSTGNLPSVEEQNAMSDAEFENLQQQALLGKFKDIE